MGLADLYPFVLSPGVIIKLNFVHTLIRSNASKAIASGGALRAIVAGLRRGLPQPT